MSPTAKAIGIMATVLLPPVAVYFAVQEIGTVSQDVKDLVRIIILLIAGALVTTVLAQAGNPGERS